jgi:hypothetical protein
VVNAVVARIDAVTFEQASLSMRLARDVSDYGKLFNDLMQRSKSEFVARQTMEV